MAPPGAAAGGPVNRIRLGGRVVRIDPLRQSPAGLPIVRFLLEHRSSQQEAGHSREARLRIAVVAAGQTLAAQVEALGIAAGSEVEVFGFLSRASVRSGEFRLVLHAERLRAVRTRSDGAFR